MTVDMISLIVDTKNMTVDNGYFRMHIMNMHTVYLGVDTISLEINTFCLSVGTMILIEDTALEV